ncbi:MAG: Endoribonuclease Nob1 [Candidatus Heimdallarchaeota archaeon AB_125]|nr:MAG: Endoribonuclease Nob1 [Candidatus Heimdallarchaeota archaeon AB_125]
MNEDKDKLNYFIVDSTAIIHQFMLENELKDNDLLLVPELLEDELKSSESKSVLTVLEAEDKIIKTAPSSESIEKISKIAMETGDISALSKIDLHVLALSLDFPDSVVYSDDNAVQNVCKKLNVKFQSFQFKIKHQREYFWKCTVCRSKFTYKLDSCPDCGSSTKRYFKKK